VALGLISFALIAMIGLFGMGLKTGHESAQRNQAANLAASLLSDWRASNPSSSFPLPALATATTGTLQVGIQGTTAIANLPPNDIYNLKYKVTPGVASHVYNVYLLLWWPAQAANPTLGSYYEITTQIVVP